MSSHLLETPGLFRRLAAMFYEILLLLGVLSVTFIVPHVILGVTLHYSNAVFQQIHFFLVLMLYFCWFWLHGGQTLAMRTWKVRIVDQSGAPLRPAQALLRYLASWPSVMLAGIGILWALVDKDKQFLHDRLAGSRIIRTQD